MRTTSPVPPPRPWCVWTTRPGAPGRTRPPARARRRPRAATASRAATCGRRRARRGARPRRRRPGRARPAAGPRRAGPSVPPTSTQSGGNSPRSSTSGEIVTSSSGRSTGPVEIDAHRRSSSSLFIASRGELASRVSLKPRAVGVGREHGGDRGRTAVAREREHGREREVPPGTVADDGEPAPAVEDGPGDGQGGLLQRGRPQRLGRERVARHEHGLPHGRRERGPSPPVRPRATRTRSRRRGATPRAGPPAPRRPPPRPQTGARRRRRSRSRRPSRPETPPRRRAAGARTARGAPAAARRAGSRRSARLRRRAKRARRMDRWGRGPGCRTCPYGRASRGGTVRGAGRGPLERIAGWYSVRGTWASTSDPPVPHTRYCVPTRRVL